MTWANILKDNRAIADYVSQLSPYEVCEEQIEEQYHGCNAVLERRALDKLTPGPDDYHISDEARQKVCDDLPVETMPPLLVDGADIVDGNHRFRTLQKRGFTHYWVYDIREAK